MPFFGGGLGFFFGFFNIFVESLGSLHKIVVRSFFKDFITWLGCEMGELVV